MPVNTVSAHRIDPTHCPLCGKPNQCGMELQKAGLQPSGPCWCSGVEFDADLLARVPPEAARLACICPDCARATLGRSRPAP
ncbi:MAG: cysteine-rich CWC family protein [Rhodoferax sp.]